MVLSWWRGAGVKWNLWVIEQKTLESERWKVESSSGSSFWFTISTLNFIRFVPVCGGTFACFYVTPDNG
jgi:hypothetical protein